MFYYGALRGAQGALRVRWAAAQDILTVLKLVYYYGAIRGARGARRVRWAAAQDKLSVNRLV